MLKLSVLLRPSKFAFVPGIAEAICAAVTLADEAAAAGCEPEARRAAESTTGERSRSASNPL